MLAMFNILITGSRVYEEPFSYPDCTKRDLEVERGGMGVNSSGNEQMCGRSMKLAVKPTLGKANIPVYRVTLIACQYRIT